VLSAWPHPLVYQACAAGLLPQALPVSPYPYWVAWLFCSRRPVQLVTSGRHLAVMKNDVLRRPFGTRLHCCHSYCPHACPYHLVVYLETLVTRSWHPSPPGQLYLCSLLFRCTAVAIVQHGLPASSIGTDARGVRSTAAHCLATPLALTGPPLRVIGHFPIPPPRHPPSPHLFV